VGYRRPKNVNGHEDKSIVRSVQSQTLVRFRPYRAARRGDQRVARAARDGTRGRGGAAGLGPVANGAATPAALQGRARGRLHALSHRRRPWGAAVSSR